VPAKRSPSRTKVSKKGALKSRAKKIDLYAEHKNEYAASAQPAFVDVGPAKYLAIMGRSKPGAEEFTAGVGALYNVAFTVKMSRKQAGSDYTVTKLEGLWWLEEGVATSPQDATWNWQLMLRVPTFISQEEVQTAIARLIAKGKPPDIRRVQLIELREGMCVQILHTGPYTAEQASIDTMRSFAEQAGRKFSGKHHEIYLSDPRRVKPEKLKTILRQPVA
jgi:hypothetical protein